ncbi:DUF1294 domain-containing protein [Bacillus sp. DNRA2]|uniref:DUF1294 domain-containing protein n=1 Tax=Bacillus sp. DNRA2 TaxID=2723053 RepID=UPI00145F01C9|nr:DUF1294 domain-containing protein [Bacillus sp. DNRA2]NMD70710.1 DUF1294 domain-containing protein [Bacillus sp. DNRA2]
MTWFLVIVNAVGFYIMGEDKRRAKKHEYRISERTLWLTAAMGGAFAMTIAMYVFHHKTKHTSFKLGFPFLAIVHAALIIYFSSNF